MIDRILAMTQVVQAYAQSVGLVATVQLSPKKQYTGFGSGLMSRLGTRPTSPKSKALDPKTRITFRVLAARPRSIRKQHVLTAVLSFDSSAPLGYAIVARHSGHQTAFNFPTCDSVEHWLRGTIDVLDEHRKGSEP